MSNKRKVKIFKLILSIVAIFLIVGIILYMFPIIKGLLTKNGKELYKKKVIKAGVGGIFMIVGLELIKVFLAFIPGEPIEIVARDVLWKNVGNYYHNDVCCDCYNYNILFSKKIWEKIYI